MADKDLDLEKILSWIFNHRTDMEAMTEISTLAYPYSRKYIDRYGSQDIDVSHD